MTSTETKWAALMREQKASGLSVRAFCEGKPFKPSTFRWWTRKLRQQAALRSEPSIRLVRAVPVRRTPSELVVEIGAARIVLREGFDAALLGQVIAALEAAR